MFKRKKDANLSEAENSSAASAGESTPETPEKSGKKKRSPEDKRRFLVAYVFALLFIALALVLLSYFNQVRATREQIANLTEEHNLFSVSALGSIDKLTAQLDILRGEREELTEENGELEDRVSDMLAERETLEAELEMSNAEREALEDENSALSLTLEAVRAAENIVALYADGSYSAAADAVTALRQSGGEAELEQFPTLYESYSNAVNRLTNRGYLE